MGETPPPPSAQTHQNREWGVSSSDTKYDIISLSILRQKVSSLIEIPNLETDNLGVNDNDNLGVKAMLWE